MLLKVNMAERQVHGQLSHAFAPLLRGQKLEALGIILLTEGLPGSRASRRQEKP